ncbi:hypothetical protein Dimus_020691 [Dionaea muscipula]
MGVSRSSSSRSLSSTFSRPFETARSSSVEAASTSKLKGVDFSSTIPKPFYRQSSPTLSPTLVGHAVRSVTVDEPLELHRVIRIKWWDTFDINKVNRSAPTPQQPQNDQELEFLKLREKAAKLEKELLQLRKRVAAFDDSQDPYEDNEDLELFSYDA